MTLGQEFDPRSNALNALRLALAVSVILWHSFPLTAHEITFPLIGQLAGAVGVDGFFAISGFLITSSWLRHPRIPDYLVARSLRILPGFYVCLVVTAFAIAPIGVAIQGGPAKNLLLSTAPIEYVLKNSAVWILQFDVGGTPAGVPFPRVWDGSLWTLGYELMCYLAVACLGLLGLLGRRWVLPAGMALCWCGLLLCTALGLPRAAADPVRFAVMFLAGALMHRYRNVIPARWSLVVLCVVIVMAASLLPDYRLVAAVPLAYAVIASGALTHNARLRLQTDLSYGVYIYAFPVQQLLVICGLGHINPFAFFAIATAATLPIAALSWAFIEEPAMSLKSRLLRGVSTPVVNGRLDPAIERQGTGGLAVEGRPE